MLYSLIQDTLSCDVACRQQYMALGYALIGGVGLLYVGSLLYRLRNLQRDLAVLAMLQEDGE